MTPARAFLEALRPPPRTARGRVACGPRALGAVRRARTRLLKARAAVTRARMRVDGARLAVDWARRHLARAREDRRAPRSEAAA